MFIAAWNYDGCVEQCLPFVEILIETVVFTITVHFAVQLNYGLFTTIHWNNDDWKFKVS